MFSGGLTLPTTHLASINHITAFRILNFALRAKDLLLQTVPLNTKSSFILRRSAAYMTPGPSQPPINPHAFYKSVD